VKYKVEARVGPEKVWERSLNEGLDGWFSTFTAAFVALQAHGSPRLRYRIVPPPVEFVWVTAAVGWEERSDG
jgi:hypothetical protein